MEIVPQEPLEQTLQIYFLWIRQVIRAKRLLTELFEYHPQKIDFVS